MTAILRSASAGLKAALASGVPLMKADLFTFTLADGTIHRWTSFDRDLSYDGNSFASRGTWVERSSWKVVNTLEVPEMTVRITALNEAFSGGAALQVQIHNGLFDGAQFLCEVAYMEFPADQRTAPDPDALGTIPLFGGKVGPIDCDGITATITMKGKVNELDQYAPRNLYQIGCNHAFCDTGCTLNRVDFTDSYSVGTSPTLSFIPWSGTPPVNATNYQGGTLAMTSGVASGSRRTIAKADSSGLTLAYPLFALPSAGDGFTAFEGCDKTFDSGSGQSCTDRSNDQNYRGYEYTPPPNAAY